MADMEQDHTQPETPANTQNLVDLGTSLIQREEGRVYVLTIVGQIEGHQLLPPTSKSPCWRRWRATRTSTACSSC